MTTKAKTKKKQQRLPSPKAQRAAAIYLEKLGRGEAPQITKVLQEAGYSELTATKDPRSVTDQAVFKETVQNALEMMEKIRAKQLAALYEKDHAKVKYRDLVDGVDKLTKNAQLLAGKETSRAGVIVQTVNFGSLEPVKGEFVEKTTSQNALEGPETIQPDTSITETEEPSATPQN